MFFWSHCTRSRRKFGALDSWWIWRDRGGGREVRSCGIIAQRRAEHLIHVGQTQDSSSGFFSLKRGASKGWMKWVEVPWRHRRGALVGRAEEEVALPCCLALQPFELVLPDFAVAGT